MRCAIRYFIVAVLLAAVWACKPRQQSGLFSADLSLYENPTWLTLLRNPNDEPSQVASAVSAGEQGKFYTLEKNMAIHLRSGQGHIIEVIRPPASSDILNSTNKSLEPWTLQLSPSQKWLAVGLGSYGAEIIALDDGNKVSTLFQSKDLDPTGKLKLRLHPLQMQFILSEETADIQLLATSKDGKVHVFDPTESEGTELYASKSWINPSFRKKPNETYQDFDIATVRSSETNRQANYLLLTKGTHVEAWRLVEEQGSFDIACQFILQVEDDDIDGSADQWRRWKPRVQAYSCKNYDPNKTSKAFNQLTSLYWTWTKGAKGTFNHVIAVGTDKGDVITTYLAKDFQQIANKVHVRRVQDEVLGDLSGTSYQSTYYTEESVVLGRTTLFQPFVNPIQNSFHNPGEDACQPTRNPPERDWYTQVAKSRAIQGIEGIWRGSTPTPENPKATLGLYLVVKSRSGLSALVRIGRDGSQYELDQALKVSQERDQRSYLTSAIFPGAIPTGTLQTLLADSHIDSRSGGIANVDQDNVVVFDSQGASYLWHISRHIKPILMGAHPEVSRYAYREREESEELQVYERTLATMKAGIMSLDVSPSQEYLASSDSSGAAFVWQIDLDQTPGNRRTRSANTHRQVADIRRDSPVVKVQFAPLPHSEKNLLVLSDRIELFRWDRGEAELIASSFESLEEKAEAPPTSDKPQKVKALFTSATFSNDGRFIYAGDALGALYTFDPVTLDLIGAPVVVKALIQDEGKPVPIIDIITYPNTSNQVRQNGGPICPSCLILIAAGENGQVGKIVHMDMRNPSGAQLQAFREEANGSTQVSSGIAGGALPGMADVSIDGSAVYLPKSQAGQLYITSGKPGANPDSKIAFGEPRYTKLRDGAELVGISSLPGYNLSRIAKGSFAVAELRRDRLVLWDTLTCRPYNKYYHPDIGQPVEVPGRFTTIATSAKKEWAFVGDSQGRIYLYRTNILLEAKDRASSAGDF